MDDDDDDVDSDEVDERLVPVKPLLFNTTAVSSSEIFLPSEIGKFCFEKLFSQL